MALIDITPIMTSNNTPSPYVASGSSILTSNYDYYKAFNNTLTDTYDAWSANGKTGWLMIDFGSPTRIDAFSVVSRFEATSPTTISPKLFNLLGSNDNINFTVIKEVTNEQLFWGSKESRLFLLNKPHVFRYYKLMLLSNNGHTSAVAIGLLKFFQDDGIQETVTNKNASLNYCLPSNSTNNMELRQNDSREGLLGFANDPDDRYGTLWMINDTGNAIIPKADLASFDILYDGLATANAVDYTLIDSIRNYRYILIEVDSGTANIFDRKVVRTDDILGRLPVKIYVSLLGNSSTWANNYFALTFKNEITFALTIVSSIAGTAGVSKIYGIR